jgi:hypothetical protein
MASTETTRNPSEAPEYSCHRIVKNAADPALQTTKELGINMRGALRALIQVVPSGGANPNVAVSWWSEEAGKFVQEHTPITKAGVGINTPYEFAVDANGRIMLVTITAGIAASQEVRVMVAGAEIGRV